jgi:hypothetical protein
MLGVIIIPLAVLFAVEMTTGRNLFSVFGGVPEITIIREDRLVVRDRSGIPYLQELLGQPLCLFL